MLLIKFSLIAVLKMKISGFEYLVFYYPSFSNSISIEKNDPCYCPYLHFIGVANNFLITFFFSQKNCLLTIQYKRNCNCSCSY